MSTFVFENLKADIGNNSNKNLYKKGKGFWTNYFLKTGNFLYDIVRI